MIFGKLNRMLAGTLRRQLVVGMVLVVATLMSLFVWDLVHRQRSSLLEHQTEHAAVMAQSVAASSAVWVASRDYSGLQEIINGLGYDPDLLHAIVLDPRGQVLAHNDASRRGLYLTDLPRRAELEFISQDAAMIDVAAPILIAGNHIGWVRVGLGQQSITERLGQITRNGVFYTLIAVALAAALALLAARRLTRRLSAIQSVADSVEAGHSELRANIKGVDEAAQLARQFNCMLDTLAKREAEMIASRDALAQSESHLSQVMAVTGEGIWDWDLQRNRIRHNPSWCAMLGLDERHLEQPEGAFTALLHEDDRDAVVDRIQDCLAGKSKYRSEHRMRRANGQVIWVQDRGDVVERDSDGRPLRMLGSMIDITDRRLLEEELHRAYGENQAITQAIHDSLYMLDGSGRLVWWNRQLEEVTGLAPETLKGMAGSEFFVAEDRSAVEQGIGKAFAEGYAEVEAQMITREGPVWYHFNGVHVHDAQGRVIGIAGVGRDISDRIQALQAVQHSERELKTLNETLEARVLERTAEVQWQSRRNETILSTALEGFFTVDATGRILDANPAFCATLGYTEAELLQMALPDIEANENQSDVAAHIERILKQGQDRFDTRHRRKDGSVVEIEISVSLAEDGDKKLFYAFARDITPRKASEAALIRARNEAERANAAKSEFLSRMSHELRTPLNAILGFGQLLETDPDHPLSATQLDNVHEVLHAGDHLLELVNEVLDLARIESGRLELNLEPVAVTTVIGACLAQIQPLAAPHGISVGLELDAPCAVQADRTRLKQVLLNLLSNAVKYNREHGSIRVSCVPAGAQRLRISVQDTGRGIHADAMPRLFKPFERIETAYEGIEGTGIGLALAKKLVEAMHGEIGVESVPGEGSTFWFELPLSEANPAMSAVGAAAASVSDNPATVGGPRKLLYVEDNPANLRLVQKILAARKDFELFDAVSGEAGLEMATQVRPDLILLDINLPGMDGFEVLRSLKDNPVTRNIPVIAVTANAMRRDIERGMAAGFSNYLTKPIKISTFTKILEACLRGDAENQA